MIKIFRKWQIATIEEIRAHTTIYILLSAILVFALFIRVYRTQALLGFYFDQGRDALIIWDLWHKGKPFLIGPVTGLAGIFLGPLYYYLIAPFYLMGGGNPATPAIFLAFLSVIATFFLYQLGWKFFNRTAGLMAVIIGSFSLNLVKAGRWLANPTPVLLTSVLLLWSMWGIVESSGSKYKFKSRFYWLAIALLIGISLQFEAASAVFYIPMIVIFAIWQKKSFPGKKTFLISITLFFITLLPQIIFNLRHENILLNNFKSLIFEEKGFRFSFWQVIGPRLIFFWNVFYSKIIPDRSLQTAVFATASFAALVIKKKSAKLKQVFKLLILFLIVPMIGFILFQGNFGNIFDYYMTGYYLPMILVFSLGLGFLWETKLGRIIVLIFFLFFFARNVMLIRYYLIAGVDGRQHITLGNELQAVDWIFENAKGTDKFNADVYVPPVIPYSYDYLLLWQGTRKCGDNLCGLLKDEQVPVLYTLYEVDPPHPWRLETWLSKYEGNTKVEEEKSFGGITAQRRRRL